MSRRGRASKGTHAAGVVFDTADGRRIPSGAAVLAELRQLIGTDPQARGCDSRFHPLRRFDLGEKCPRCGAVL